MLLVNRSLDLWGKRCCWNVEFTCPWTWCKISTPLEEPSLFRKTLLQNTGLLQHFPFQDISLLHIPYLYPVSKIHKPNNPGCPIDSSHHSITECISAFVNIISTCWCYWCTVWWSVQSMCTEKVIYEEVLEHIRENRTLLNNIRSRKEDF